MLTFFFSRVASNNPTEHFSISRTKNPSINEFYSVQKCRPADYEAVELWKFGRVKPGIKWMPSGSILVSLSFLPRRHSWHFSQLDAGKYARFHFHGNKCVVSLLRKNTFSLYDPTEKLTNLSIYVFIAKNIDQENADRLFHSFWGLKSWDS